MTTRALDAYIEGTQNLPVMGHLFWYSITGALAPHADVAACSARHNMPTPAVPKAKDTFERVAKSSTMADRLTRESDSKRYLVRKTTTRGGARVATVVAERVNHVEDDAVDLTFQQTVDVVFDELTGTPQLRVDRYDAPQECIDIARDIIARFDDEVGKVTGWTIRERIVRAAVKDKGFLPVSDAGGMFFAPIEAEEGLNQIVGFINCLPAGTSSIHVVPILDVSAQREMIRAAFVRDNEGRATKLLGELTGNRERKLRKDRVERLTAEYWALLGERKQYAAMVNAGLSEADDTIEMIGDILAQLNPEED